MISGAASSRVLACILLDFYWISKGKCELMSLERELMSLEREVMSLEREWMSLERGFMSLER